jgi:hypothetical protein
LGLLLSGCVPDLRKGTFKGLSQCVGIRQHDRGCCGRRREDREFTVCRRKAALCRSI